MNRTFTENDDFQRLPVAENIIRLLSITEVPVSPLLIDGDWGEGKTEFCHKVLDMYQSTHHVVYVDAFSTDHLEDPLLSIISAIAKLIPEGQTRTEFYQKVVPGLRVAGKVAGKAAVSWVLKQDTADIANDYDKQLQKGGDQAVDAFIGKMLKDQVEAEKNLDSLRDALKLLTEGEDGKTIIICIDELDRCRPNYAISILEVIKHIFDTDKVQFILSANSKVLTASINHHYGSHVDAERYLDKFVATRIQLPNSHRAMTDVGTFGRKPAFSHLLQLITNGPLTTTFDRFKNADHPGYSSLMAILYKLLNFTLRDAEKLYRNIVIYDALAEEKLEELDEIRLNMVILGIVTFSFYPKQYYNQDTGLFDLVGFNKVYADLDSISSFMSVPGYLMEYVMTSLLLIEDRKIAQIKNTHQNEALAFLVKSRPEFKNKGIEHIKEQKYSESMFQAIKLLSNFK